MFTLEQAINHPLSQKISELFNVEAQDLFSVHQSIDKLIDGSIDFDTYFASNLFKKVRNVNIGIDPIQVAKDDFISRITLQQETAYKVRYMLENPNEFPGIHRILNKVRRKFHNLLGDFHPSYIRPRYTFGATKGHPRSATFLDRIKSLDGYDNVINNLNVYYAEYPDFTRGLDPYINFIKGKPQDTGSNAVAIDVVWKTAKIGRVIGKSSTASMPLQNGIGDYLQKQARKVGLDISSDQSKHNMLAFENSLDDELSSSDQSNSSDNILTVIMQFLLPPSLYDYMRVCTSDTVLADGKEYKVHMMAPQGNGYIFPLQTLFYLFIAQVITIEKGGDPKGCHAYGDDVFIPNIAYEDFHRFLMLLGFKPNPEKSYSANIPFRESCGGDYLYGHNVRALYATHLPETTIQWISLINGIRRVGFTNNASSWRSFRYLRLWAWCINNIPANERLFCPSHYGDGGINTVSEKRYRISHSKVSSNTRLVNDKRWESYPNGGFDAEGNPYSAERISIYTSSIIGENSAFDDQISGLPWNMLKSLFLEPALQNKGQYEYRNQLTSKQVLKLEKIGRAPSLYTYPMYIRPQSQKYVLKKVPYSLCPPASEDIDALFASLPDAVQQRLNPVDVVARAAWRQHVYIQKMVNVLTALVNKRQAAIAGLVDY